MGLHLEKEIHKLKRQMSKICTLVEENVRMAIESVNEKNCSLALEVIERDDTIDRKEIELEEECLKILALHQPVAADLRHVIAYLKMNNDLERIGDLAVSMAKRSLMLAKEKDIHASVDFSIMMHKTRDMLKKGIDALFNMDEALAYEVYHAEEELNLCKKNIIEQVIPMIKDNPEDIEYFLNIIAIARHLKRIADYITNITEDLIYMISGDIVRHTPDL